AYECGSYKTLAVPRITCPTYRIFLTMIEPKVICQAWQSLSIPTTLSPPAGQLLPSPAIQPRPPGVPSYPTDQIFQPIDTSKDDGTLSQETILKIREFKRLVYRNPQYYSNLDAVIKCATYWSITGDNTLLDEWLEQLRSVDALANTKFSQSSTLYRHYRQQGY
ncbi:MAG: hypothetical protein WBE68_12890, partial [Candidatus Nitrosopolaris sp.]